MNFVIFLNYLNSSKSFNILVISFEMNTFRKIQNPLNSIIRQTKITQQLSSFSTSTRIQKCSINSSTSTVCAGKSYFSTSVSDIYDNSKYLDENDKTIIKARRTLGIKKIPYYVLKKSSMYLYESCTDSVSIENFIKELQLEDTFSAWFNITRLHVWMLAARCMAEEAPNNKILRNEMIERMWEDCTERLNKLGGMTKKFKNSSLKTYSHEFNSTLFSLDEGILSDDKTLFGALWRTVFLMDKNANIENIELLLKYVHCQMEHIHLNCRTDQILFSGKIEWKKFEKLNP